MPPRPPLQTLEMHILTPFIAGGLHKITNGPGGPVCGVAQVNPSFRLYLAAKTVTVESTEQWILNTSDGSFDVDFRGTELGDLDQFPLAPLVNHMPWPTTDAPPGQALPLHVETVPDVQPTEADFIAAAIRAVGLNRSSTAYVKSIASIRVVPLDELPDFTNERRNVLFQRRRWMERLEDTVGSAVGFSYAEYPNPFTGDNRWDQKTRLTQLWRTPANAPTLPAVAVIKHGAPPTPLGGVAPHSRKTWADAVAAAFMALGDTEAGLIEADVLQYGILPASYDDT